MTASNDCVFVINPGSTSTKLAFVGPQSNLLWETNLRHEGDAPASMRELVPVRVAQVRELLASIAGQYHPRAVVGRGGPLRPMDGGTYTINDTMIEELLSERWSKHVSNLGAPLARNFAAEWSVPAYVVDPVSVDNFTDLARISGIPDISRKCRSHALNIRSCAYLASEQICKEIKKTRFVVAHLGGGISIAAVEGGRIVDVNDGLLGMGPFSPERAGALPLEGVLDLIGSGKFTVPELKAYLSKGSGLKGYLGTNNLIEVETRIDAGDEKALLIFRAMVYQIAKEIGACSAVMQGQLDAMVITGGLANSKRLLRELDPYIGWITKTLVFPGERELEAMAAGAYRVLNGAETAREY
jgi:butyrate kinase